MSVPTLPLSNEDQLDLASSVVSLADGNTRIANGKNFLHLNGASMNELVATIPYTALDPLYEEVNAFCSSAKNCVTALRMYYAAVVNGEKVTFDLFYQPLFLYFTDVVPEPDTREYEIRNTGNLYRFVAGSFVLQTPIQLEAAQLAYAANITLKHTPTTPAFAAFIPGKDVTAGVLPFQTIFALLNDNGNDEFNIKVCADIDGTTVSGEVKQSVILDSAEVTGSGAFAGKFANRVLKNPPYSNKFEF